MAVLIKRYANRKLYNTETSRYITLKGISDLIEEGEEVHVVDNETGEDITSIALSQILVDRERSRTLSSAALSDLMQRSSGAIASAFRKHVGEASEGFEGLQKNMRRFLEVSGGKENRDMLRITEWIAAASPELEKILQRGIERVVNALDLPSRTEIDAIHQKLESILEKLEQVTAQNETRTSVSSAEKPQHKKDEAAP